MFSFFSKKVAQNKTEKNVQVGELYTDFYGNTRKCTEIWVDNSGNRQVYGDLVQAVQANANEYSWHNGSTR